MLVKDLLSALKTVNLAIGTNGVVPEYGAYRFTDKTVSACDGQIVITAPCDIDNFKAIVPQQPFFNIIKSLPATKDIVLTRKDNTVNIKCGRTNVDINTVNSDNYISAKSFDKTEQDFSYFIDAVKMCFPLVYKDAGQIYHHLYLKNGFAYGCDRYRCIRAETKIDLNNFILPNKICKMISEADKIYGYDVDSSAITVLFDNDVRATCAFPVRTGKDRLDDYEGLFFETDEEGVVSFKFEKCSDVFKRHVLLQDNIPLINRDSLIEFKDGETCILSTVNATMGSVEDTLDVALPVDEPIKFYVTPEFLSAYVDECGVMCLKKQPNESWILMLSAPAFQYAFTVRVC